MNVAEQLVAQLVDAGVHRIYGIVGDSLNPIVDAVRKTGGSAKGGIDWVHVRHEEAAAFAAAAEAQLTGELSVCAGSCGPGNLHLINGLYDAQRSGAPVLAIASHIPSVQIGQSYFPPGSSVQRVLGLLRAHLHPQAGPSCRQRRNPPRCQPERRERDLIAGRCLR